MGGSPTKGPVVGGYMGTVLNDGGFSRSGGGALGSLARLEWDPSDDSGGVTNGK